MANPFTIPTEYPPPPYPNSATDYSINYSRKKSRIAISITSILLLLGCLTVSWVASFKIVILADSDSDETLYPKLAPILLLPTLFILTSSVLLLVSTLKHITNYGFTISGIVFSSISLLGSLAVGMFFAVNSDEHKVREWYQYSTEKEEDQEYYDSSVMITVSSFLISGIQFMILIVSILELIRAHNYRSFVSNRHFQPTYNHNYQHNQHRCCCHSTSPNSLLSHYSPSFISNSNDSNHNSTSMNHPNYGTQCPVIVIENGRAFIMDRVPSSMIIHPSTSTSTSNSSKEVSGDSVSSIKSPSS